MSRGELRRPARLIPVWVALTATFTAAVAVAGATLWLGLDLLDVHGIKREKQITSSVLFDLVKLSFAVVAGLGGLVALVVAYRKQRTEENAALREDTKLHSDRFTAAVAQLGDSSPAVQLGGVHALAGLADDAPTRQLRQTCIDVLCAYLRLPYDPDPGDAPAEGQDPAEHARARAAFRAIREVRHTVIRIIGNHLRDDAAVSWQGHDLDFTDVIFDGGDFSHATFNANRVSFRSARFAGGRVSFKNARFEGGTVAFTNTRFEDGTVTFDDARFAGGIVSFYGARFAGGSVGFVGARFAGGRVSFDSARFEDGLVGFFAAWFEGGTVSFDDARVAGGVVGFAKARFTAGLVDLGGVRFAGGMVSFKVARFEGGRVRFDKARFTGGAVGFGSVRFAEGTVSFNDARFEGGTLDFSGATGRKPVGLAHGMADHLS
ncbi:pentapeptide repeat-containing protein [Spirillospora sp. NPDC048832]